MDLKIRIHMRDGSSHDRPTDPLLAKRMLKTARARAERYIGFGSPADFSVLDVADIVKIEVLADLPPSQRKLFDALTPGPGGSVDDGE